MKQWLWKTDDSTLAPIVVCPYCSTALSPLIMYWFTRCPFCHKRVHLPKKDYWESMKEEGEAE